MKLNALINDENKTFQLLLNSELIYQNLNFDYKMIITWKPYFKVQSKLNSSIVLITDNKRGSFALINWVRRK